jgi:hypothetical protein
VRVDSINMLRIVVINAIPSNDQAQMAVRFQTARSRAVAGRSPLSWGRAVE